MDEPIDPYMGDEHEESASGLGAEHDELKDEDEEDEASEKHTDEQEDTPPYMGEYE